MITFKGGWSRWARVAVVVISCLLSLTSHLSIHAQRYVGGDISVLLKYEQQNATYLDKDGAAIADVLNFLKQQGWNTMRVRLFVDPSNDKDKNVCQDLEYVKTLGKRIKDAGLLFMLDFHYSDTWADPGKQIIPDSWKIWSWMPDETVYNYTKETLEALVAAGAVPDLIQTGNEISFGMLWGFNLDGKYEDWEQWGGHLEATADWKDYTDKHWDNFSKMLKAAGKACREVCPEAGITDKAIQIVETGYPSKWEVPGTKYDLTKTYPYTPEGQRQYTADLIMTLQKHPQVNGLSWWYAEANAKGCTGSLATGWYNASLFDNETGRALPALYELKAFLGSETSVYSLTSDLLPLTSETWYTLQGLSLPSKPSRCGLYINNGKKIWIK